MVAKASTADQFTLFGEDEADVEMIPIVRRYVSAKGQPMPKTEAPRSIFDMAAAAAKAMRCHGRFGDTAGFKTSAPQPVHGSRMVAKVQVTNGVTRFVGAAYPARWTAEDDERERQRRARQRPPKPSKKAKTRGRKLLDMIGGDDDGA